MSPAFKLWCLAVSVVLVAQCGVECVKRNKSLGPPVENDEECIVSKLIPKVVTNKIVNPLSTASIGLANKALAQVDKYVDYAVKKYHGKQPPKRVLSKNRSSKGKPSVFNPHPTDIIRKILNVGDGDNDNGFTNINGIKKGIPGQELSNSRNSKQKSNELKPKPNGGSFKNIGNVENYDYSGITIDNGVIKGLNGRELSNLKNSKKRPNDRNPKSNGEFFSNIGNDDEFSGLNMSEDDKKEFPSQELSNSGNSNKRPDVPNPYSNGRFFKNIGKNGKYNFSGITINNEVKSGLPDEDLSNSGNSKQRPKNVPNSKSKGEFFSNFGNDDGYGEVPKSDAAKANIEEIRASNKLK